MNIFNSGDIDPTAGMNNEQKSQASKIMVLSIAKVWGEFRYINRLFRESNPNFQIITVEGYHDNALGWLQCIEDRLLDALMESPLMPIFEYNEMTEQQQEVSIENMRGFLHLSSEVLEQSLAEQVGDIDVNEINLKIKEEMEANAQEAMSDEELTRRTLDLNN